MVYFNSEKLTIENEVVTPTNTRDINHYTFKTENNISIEVFVTHLKVSTGDTNREKRLSAVSVFKEKLNELPTDSYVLFAGDFNFYTSNEEGYLKLINNTSSTNMIDPINRPCTSFPDDNTDYFSYDNYNSTYFWNNSSFEDIHTQSTRTSNNSLIDQSGATGGIDDRFDFIMISENLKTSSGLYYIEDSYKAIGNNSNCYNSYINNTNCSGDFSQSLRDSLIEFSDHLPVVMEIEIKDTSLSLDSENINTSSFIQTKITDDFLNITLNNTNVDFIYVYNQLGQLIIKHDTEKKLDNTININYLAKGMYFLKTNKSLPTIKFIKK